MLLEEDFDALVSRVFGREAGSVSAEVRLDIIVAKPVYNRPGKV